MVNKKRLEWNVACLAVAGLLITMGFLAIAPRTEAALPFTIEPALFSSVDGYPYDGAVADADANFANAFFWLQNRADTNNPQSYGQVMPQDEGWFPAGAYGWDVGSPIAGANMQIGETITVVFETVYGQFGWDGVNFTAGTSIVTDNVDGALPAAPWMMPYPVPVTSLVGTTLSLDWTGVTEQHQMVMDGTMDLVTINTVLGYNIYRSDSTEGPWTLLDFVEHTGDGDALTYDDDVSGLPEGTYYYEMSIMYKGENYLTDSSMYETIGRSERVSVFVEEVIDPIDVPLRAGYGFQMIAIPTDSLEGYFASDLAESLETTGRNVLQVSMFDGSKWIDYLRRSSDTEDRLTQFDYTDFELEAGYGYFVLFGVGAATTWTSPWGGATGPMELELHAGWNNVGYVYAAAAVTMGDLLASPVIDRAVAWTGAGWDYTGTDSVAYQPVGSHTYDLDANAHGFFVRSPSGGTWTQA